MILTLAGANFLVIKGVFEADNLIEKLPDLGGPVVPAAALADAALIAYSPPFLSENPALSPPLHLAAPAPGWNWGRLHPVNAVDIANRCGAPILAAADGVVTKEKSSGWNDGYGNYITLEHKNGTVTRYAHTQKNLFDIGHHVLQGDLIALVGNSGNTHGPTGCHLHFEVWGQENPLVK